MQKLLIFPFNGNGLEALDCLGDQYELIGYVDDTPEKQGKTPDGLEIFSRQALDKYPEAQVLAVPGNHVNYRSRLNVIGGLKINPKRWATVIHPSARISHLAKVGTNVLILAGTVLTSNAVIGHHVCILANSVIHHDVTVDDFTIIGSHVTVAGHVKIGSSCYIGSGASLISGIQIGDGALVGMAANVLQSIPSEARVVGNPARLLS